ncbi:MAG: OmpA family protein [Deltaproteobacteria bacterium]|nr:OmpA family protein [Deltaproteobacteria bacterium]
MRPRTPRSSALGLLGIALALALPDHASAQERRDDGIDVQQLRPGAGASDYLHVLGGFMGRHLGVTAGAVFDHADVVLLSDRKGEGVKSGILDGQSTLNLLGAFTAWERLELGLAVPLVLSQTTGPAYPVLFPGTSPPDGFALGDIRFTPKVKLFGLARELALSIAAPVSLPTGSSFAGFGGLSVEPRLVIDIQPAYYFRLTLNAGARFRSETTLGDQVTLGNEAVWGVGMKFSFFVGDQLFSLPVSFAGGFPLDEPESKNDPPFEFATGLEWRGVRDLAVFAALGAGLTKGYGSPDLRAIVGVKYGGYRDCPYGEEDLDGWEDDDACADLDNDADGIHDVTDMCPNEPEVKNGWEDEDGCPDVPLAFVRPLDGKDDPEAATRDSDNDGVPDAFDRCPDVAEDFDGFEDGDGCPEGDNDLDGILDIADACANVGEVVNGFKDDDGCPDEQTGPVRVDDVNRQITITDKIYFDTGKTTIQERSFELLAAIATLLDARKDIMRLRIEGHTDDVGPDDFNQKLSAGRAEAVAQHLVGKGVAPDRLETRGAGESEPIADNKTPKGRAENRRVEFEIVEYGNPDGTRLLEVPQPLPEAP